MREISVDFVQYQCILSLVVHCDVCVVANHNGSESKNHDAVQQVIHQWVYLHLFYNEILSHISGTCLETYMVLSLCCLAVNVCKWAG